MVRTSLFPILLLIPACTGSAPTGATSSSSASSTAASSSAASSGAGTSGGGAGGAGSGGAGQGGAVGACTACDGACVDTQNDARHCGACGHACPDKQHCDHGACGTPTCLIQGPICPNDHLCCGEECCPAWKMCCNVPGGTAPTCVPVDAGACPTTCAACP